MKNRSEKPDTGIITAGAKCAASNHKPLRLVPLPPENYSERHAAKWRETCLILLRADALCEYHLYLIDMYVTTWFIAKDAWDSVIKEGRILENGQINPCVEILETFRKSLKEISDNFFGYLPAFGDEHLN